MKTTQKILKSIMVFISIMCVGFAYSYADQDPINWEPVPGWTHKPEIIFAAKTPNNNIYLTMLNYYLVVDKDINVIYKSPNYVYQPYNYLNINGKLCRYKANSASAVITIYSFDVQTNLWREYYKLPTEINTNYIGVIDSLFFASTKDNSIKTSTDYGITWTTGDCSNLPKLPYPLSHVLLSYDHSTSTIFAMWNGFASHDGQAQVGGLIVSNDNGKTWQTTPIQKTNVRGGLRIGNKVYFLKYDSRPENGSIIATSDNGKTFEDVDFGFLPRYFIKLDGYSDKVYAIDKDIIYETNANDVSWKKSELSPLTGAYLGNFFVISGQVFVKIADNLLKFDPIQKTWITIYQPQSDGQLKCMTVVGKDIFGIKDDAIQKSSDNGNTWQQVKKQIFDYSKVVGSISPTTMKIIGDKVYIGTFGQGLWVGDLYSNEIFKPAIDLSEYIIKDPTKPGELLDLAPMRMIIYSIEKVGNKIIATNPMASLYSEDEGKTWKHDEDTLFFGRRSGELLYKNGKLYLNSWDLYVSEDLGKNWSSIKVNSPDGIINGAIYKYSILDDGTIIVFVDGVSMNIPRVWVSKDNGQSFTAKSTITSTGKPLFIGSNPNFLFSFEDITLLAASKSNYGLYMMRMKDEGWTLLNNGIENFPVINIDTTAEYVFITTSNMVYRTPKAIFRSSNVEDIRFEPLLAYPNPSQDYIKLMLKEPTNYNYSIINSSGQVILKGKFDNDQINIRDLPNGHYIIKIFDSKESYTSKFVKE